MRLRSSSEPELGVPNMMPLIDLVFLLLIFFLMASRFEADERLEKQLKVTLPEVSSAQPLSAKQELIVNISPEGKYVIAQGEYSEAQLAGLLEQTRQKNPHTSVLIRGDGRSAWKHGVRVMGLCNRAALEYRVAAVQE